MADKARTERARARDLRLTDSRAEQAVWELLRAHRMGGLKFRRQHPIGPYFADFASVQKKLVIELDGKPLKLGHRPGGGYFEHWRKRR